MITMLSALGRRLRSRGEKGVILVIVMLFVALMAMCYVYGGNMLKQDISLIQRVKHKGQALYMAEAGIYHALAKMKDEGFDSRSDFTGSLDTGSYSVTFSESGGRQLVTSAGTVGGVSVTVSAEIEDSLPSALNFLTGAGNDVKIHSFVAAAGINGDIHANNDVYLKSGIIANLDIDGDVSATGIVKEGSRLHKSDALDTRTYINGINNDAATVYEGSGRITFPDFNYDGYKQEAIDSGDYYSSSQNFDGVSLSPANGIVYVDGNASFKGNCTINGGIIADSITINGILNQNKSGERNVVIARSGDIGVAGSLVTEEALVYAAKDIRSLQVGANIDVSGILLAGRDIRMWNVLTNINYNYVRTYPSDLGSDAEQPFNVISWNR